MSYIPGTEWSVTATHATAATATKTALADATYYITDIAASSDKAGAIATVYDGTTAIWQLQVGATHVHQSFSTPLRVTKSAACSIAIDGTSVCKANLAGFTSYAGKIA